MNKLSPSTGLDPLVPGSLYELTYIQPSGNGRWYQWQMRAVFLYRTHDEHVDDCVFSLRPRALTIWLPTERLHDVKCVKRDAGARNVQAKHIVLPKRLKGAVPGPSVLNKRKIVFQESW